MVDYIAVVSLPVIQEPGNVIAVLESDNTLCHKRSEKIIMLIRSTLHGRILAS